MPDTSLKLVFKYSVAGSINVIKMNSSVQVKIWQLIYKYVLFVHV